MTDLKQYDSAIAKYHNRLGIKMIPVSSLSFYYEFTDALKNHFSDLNKLNQIAHYSKWINNNSWSFNSLLNEEVVIVTDTKQTIVFASQNCIKMNGYKESEIIGKSPKIFQGDATCKSTSKKIRKAIELQLPFEETILNYKKNGKTYLCKIKGFPVYNTQGILSHFIAFEKQA